ncbi:MAG: ABC transporter ATP-binding protein [Coriobacteriia bacterium]|nr:ABC transporter ATP-binding protein [Coriobacteriia bacterium]
MTHVMEAKNATIQFGGLKAVDSVDMYIDEGEIVALIGPNGAGKTTFFNLLTGIYEPTDGDVFFDGVSVVGEKPHVIAKRGISRTFQNIRLFGALTALENVMVGRHLRTSAGALAAMFRLPAQRREEQMIQIDAERWLEFVGLSHLANEVANNLPYGAQRRLEIARALATDPKLICLDEPAAGMNPHETEELNKLIGRIRDLGVTVFLIEHDMKVVMEIAERIYVLDFGKLIAQGTPDEIQHDPAVIEAYLGLGAEALMARNLDETKTEQALEFAEEQAPLMTEADEAAEGEWEVFDGENA